MVGAILAYYMPILHIKIARQHSMLEQLKTCSECHFGSASNYFLFYRPDRQGVIVELVEKNIVITGAGSGIGRALAVKFKAMGARCIVAVDIDAEKLAATAQAIDCVAVAADVSDPDAILAVIDKTENEYGPIDLFCSNAGIARAPALESPGHEWQASWDINVMAHVYAARYLVPRMVARGGGYFMHTASAAGLLNQIGGAAYGTTKHAAVGFGEWLAMTYGHQGIKVSMLCPQAVRTAMTVPQDVDMISNTEKALSLGDKAIAAASMDGMIEPEQLADAVVEGLREERFLILPHPEVLDYMQRKASDYDRWLGGMNRLVQKLS